MASKVGHGIVVYSFDDFTGFDDSDVEMDMDSQSQKVNDSALVTLSNTSTPSTSSVPTTPFSVPSTPLMQPASPMIPSSPSLNLPGELEGDGFRLTESVVTPRASRSAPPSPRAREMQEEHEITPTVTLRTGLRNRFKSWSEVEAGSKIVDVSKEVVVPRDRNLRNQQTTQSLGFHSLMNKWLPYL